MDESEERLKNLVERAGEGDLEAQDALFREFEGWLKNLAEKCASSKVRRAEGTDDIVLSFFRDLLPDLNGVEYTTSRRFRGWLRTRLINKIIDKWRRLRNRPPEVSLDASDFSESRMLARSGDPTPSRAAAGNEQVARLRGFIAGLPDGQRDVVRFRLFDDMPFDEIGRRLQRSANAVRKLYYRAIRNLADDLDEIE